MIYWRVGGADKREDIMYAPVTIKLTKPWGFTIQ